MDINISSLEEITSNVFKKILSKNICLPSDYLLAFNEESKGIESIDDIISEQIKKDYEKAQEIMQKTISSLEKSKEILSKSVEMIVTENKEEIVKMSSNMNSMLEFITTLTSELYTDELTKAYNRKWLFNEYMKDSECMKEAGILVFIDLNNFKNINDTYGHYIGDKVLAYFVTFLNTEFKKDIHLKYNLVRFAGDEFILIFKNNEKLIEELLKMTKENLNKKVLCFQNKNGKFKIDFSYGIAPFKHNENIHKVMKKADKHMYHMKSKKININN